MAGGNNEESDMSMKAVSAALMLASALLQAEVAAGGQNATRVGLPGASHDRERTTPDTSQESVSVNLTGVSVQWAANGEDRITITVGASRPANQDILVDVAVAPAKGVKMAKKEVVIVKGTSEAAIEGVVSRASTPTTYKVTMEKVKGASLGSLKSLSVTHPTSTAQSRPAKPAKQKQ